MQAAFTDNAFSAPTMDPISLARTLAAEDKPQKAPPPPAVIRPYDATKDLKYTRYLVGSAVMEPSAEANQRALFTPFGLILSLSLTHLLVTFLTSGYPAFLHNLFASPAHQKPLNPDALILQSVTDALMLVPLLVAPPIILLALFEFRHRAVFEGEMRRVIGEEDLRDVKGFYGVEGGEEIEEKEEDEGQQQQRKGFWVLEYDGRLIGAIGLDGRKAGQTLDSTVDLELPSPSEKKDGGASASTSATDVNSTTTATSGSDATLAYALRSRAQKAKDLAPAAPSLSVTPPTPAVGGTSSSFPVSSPSSSLPDGTLHLRRFATSLSFRAAGIEDDLLSFLGSAAFSPRLSTAPGAPSAKEPAAKNVVTVLRPNVQKALARRLRSNGWVEVPRGSELEVTEGGDGKGKTLVERLWPLDLQQRTYVLTKAAWERREAAERSQVAKA